MPKDDNITHREHYIPQFFIQQFYATETNLNKNMKKNKICCYDLQKNFSHEANSNDVFFEEYLYETAAKNEELTKVLLDRNNELETVVNYFEHQFGNMEKTAGKYFKQLLLNCERQKDRDKILSCNQVEYFIKYMIWQFLRIPYYIDAQVETVDETFFNGQGICQNNDTMALAAKHMIFKTWIHPKSEIIKALFESILFYHDMCVFKMMDNHSFFSSNIPIFFFDCDDYVDVFKYSTIVFPISPKYCIVFLKCKYKKHTKRHKTLIHVGTDAYKRFICQFISTAIKEHNRIFSDSISNELMTYIKTLNEENKDDA